MSSSLSTNTPWPSRGDFGYDPLKHSSIFISIAAYRDPECRNTVLQVFERAKYPDRLRLGIFTQNNLTDPDCSDFRDVLNCDSDRDYSFLFQHDDEWPEGSDQETNHWRQRYADRAHVLCGRLWQIRTDRVDWRDGLGPTYGRYRAEQFFDDEDYVLQMDSHTALVQDWDTVLIAMHIRLRNDYGVLTTYPKPLRFPTLYHYEVAAFSESSPMYVICGTGILTDKKTKSFKLRPARSIPSQGRLIMVWLFVILYIGNVMRVLV